MLTWKALLNGSPFLQTGWRGLFVREQSLNLEIGCGHGHFLLRMARQHPDENFIGLDLISKLLAKTQRQIERESLGNALVLKTDALLALRELFADGQINRIDLNFPDPWPKERHRRRRILQTGTLPLYEWKLKPGGELHFVTDAAAYARDVAQLLAASPAFEPLPALLPSSVQTKYERKWTAKNRLIYRLAYRKMPGPALPAEMPEYTRRRPLPRSINPLTFFQGFQPWLHQSGDLILRFQQCFINSSQTKVLLKITLAEPGFLSHSFFLELDGRTLMLPPASYIPRYATQERVWQALEEAIQER